MWPLNVWVPAAVGWQFGGHGVHLLGDHLRDVHKVVFPIMVGAALIAGLVLFRWAAHARHSYLIANPKTRNKYQRYYYRYTLYDYPAFWILYLGAFALFVVGSVAFHEGYSQGQVNSSESTQSIGASQ